MEPASPELIRCVKEDLDYICDRWPDAEVSSAELRHASCILRRLFVYKDLISVWTTVVGREEFRVSSPHLRVQDIRSIDDVLAVNVSEVRCRNGITLHGMWAFNTFDPEKVVIARDVREVSLKHFMSHVTCVTQGSLIHREDIVKFVANKLGGAHYDNNRRLKNEPAIDHLQLYELGGLKIPVYEMLAYGQALAASPSTQRLREGIHRSGL